MSAAIRSPQNRSFYHGDNLPFLRRPACGLHSLDCSHPALWAVIEAAKRLGRQWLAMDWLACGLRQIDQP